MRNSRHEIESLKEKIISRERTIEELEKENADNSAKLTSAREGIKALNAQLAEATKTTEAETLRRRASARFHALPWSGSPASCYPAPRSFRRSAKARAN